MSTSWQRLAFQAFLLSGALSWGTQPLPALEGGDKEPPLERLIELNKRELFGADAALTNGGRVTLTFPDNGAFSRAFISRTPPGRGFLSTGKDFGTVTVKDLIKESEGKVSFAGVLSGSAVSRFQLADDFKISFKLKIPNLGRSAQLSLLFNQQDQKSFIQTNFFQDITVHGRRSRQAVTQEKQFAVHASGWFDRTSKGVPVEIVFKDKKLSITMAVKRDKKQEKPEKPENVQLVALDGIEAPRAGRMAWNFNGMSFVVTDLTIEGKIDEAWARAEIAALREKGHLLLKPPEEVATAGEKKDERKGADAKGDGGKAEPPGGGRPVKKGGVNIDKPDPEAEEDL